MHRTRNVFCRFYRRPFPVIVPYGIVRQFKSGKKISGSSGGGLTISDLLLYIPPKMVLWYYAHRNNFSDLRIDLSKGQMSDLYDRFDAFLDQPAASARTRELRHLIGATRDPSHPSRLPRFRLLVALLNSNFFDVDKAMSILRRDREWGSAESQVHDRLVCALRWIAAYGDAHCWLRQERPGTAANLTTQSRVIELLTQGMGAAHGGADHSVLYFALFATDQGPPFRKILDYFGHDKVAAALNEFITQERRPLRELLTARLGACLPEA
jgi:lysyl-tRNA synthetase class 1